MTSIRIYESALCCDTGVCGVDVDEALVTLTADVRHLQSNGVDISRHNLASDPVAFTTDDTVKTFMNTVGSQGLPLTVVDGVTVAAGTYPTRNFLESIAGIQNSPTPGERRDLGLSATKGSQEESSGACCFGGEC